METHITTVFTCACGNRYIYLPHEDAAQGIHEHLVWAHGIVGGVVPPNWRSRVQYWRVVVGRRMDRVEAHTWWRRKGDGRWIGRLRA